MADRTLEIGVDIENKSAVVAAQTIINIHERIEASVKKFAETIEARTKVMLDREVKLTQEAQEKKAAAIASAGERQSQQEQARQERETKRQERELDRQTRQREREAERQTKVVEREALRQQRAEEKAAQEATDAKSASMSQYVSSFVGGIGKIIGASVVLSAVSSFAHSFSNALKEGKKEAEDLAKYTAEIRDKIKDIVALRGGSAATHTDMAKFSDLRVQSGLSADAAHDFAIDYESSVATASDQNMSEAEKAKLKMHAARFAARTLRPGESPTSTAALAGTLARFQKGGNAETVVAQMDRLNNIMNLGDGSNDEQRVQLNKVLTYLVSPDGKGLAKSPQQAAGLTAMMSTTGPPGEAATGVEQMTRALRGFQKRMTHGGFEKSQAAFLKDAGIRESDTVVESMEKLVPVIDKEVQAGRAPDAFLKQFFHSDEEVSAVTRAYRAYKSGTAQKILGEANRPLDPREAMAKENAYMSSKGGRRGVASARIDQAKMYQGMQTEEAEIQKMEAEADLTDQGKLGNAGANEALWWRGRLAGYANPLEGGKALAIQERIRERARKQGVRLPDERGELGKAFQEKFGFPMQSPIGQDYRSGTTIDSGQANLDVASAYDQAHQTGRVPKVGAAYQGGDPIGREMLAEQRKTNELLSRQQRGPITDPVPGGGRPTRQD